MCRKVIVTAVEELVAPSNSVMKAVPAYDHVFSAPKLNLKTAATFLVSWPAKKALGVGCIALEKAMREASKAYTTWSLGASPMTLRDDPELADAVRQVEDSFLCAKKALVTIAGVNCLANTSGIERLNKRDQLLEKADLLPKLLVRWRSANTAVYSRRCTVNMDGVAMD